MTLWDFRSFVQGDAEVAWKLLEQLAEMLHRQSAATHSAATHEARPFAEGHLMNASAIRAR